MPLLGIELAYIGLLEEGSLFYKGRHVGTQCLG